MNVLLLKLALTPTLIGALSVAGRRWGPSVSGWLVGLPLTSGPVAFILAVDQGTPFAARASIGILMGTLSAGAFCAVYAWLAFPFKWWLALPLSWLAFLACTFGLRYVQFDGQPAVVVEYVVVIATAAFVLLALSRLPRMAATRAASLAPGWDIPARMLIATAFVLLLTASASVLGPQLSGLLAPFPIYTTILTVFTHRLDGPAAAAELLRGVVLGLFAFSTFFLVVAALLVPLGIGLTFTAASAAALGVEGTTLWVLRRSRLGPVAPEMTPAESARRG